MRRMNRTPVLILTAAAAAISLAIAVPSLTFAGGGDDDRDRNRDNRIVSLDRRVDHRTYGEWTEAWWQWATAFAPDVNPVFDLDGANAGQGQSGPVWFLAGTFGGTAVRNVEIPADKYLLLPLANGEWDTVPGFANPLGLPDPPSVADLRDILAYGTDDTSVNCAIDGLEVRHPRSFRVRSPVFSMNFDADFASAVGYPVEYVRTAVSDGFWLMLKPLAAGSHTIHFTAENPVTGFALDVTYNITVTP